MGRGRPEDEEDDDEDLGYYQDRFPYGYENFGLRRRSKRYVKRRRSEFPMADIFNGRLKKLNYRRVRKKRNVDVIPQEKRKERNRVLNKRHVGPHDNNGIQVSRDNVTIELYLSMDV